MSTITDEEFGNIILSRSARASNIRIRVTPDGRLRASLPLYAPIFLVKRLVKSSREQLRAMLQEQQGVTTFEHGMQIGKSHTLIVRSTNKISTDVERHGQQIIASLAATHSIEEPQVQRLIRDEVIKAMRIEAKSHLPRRLTYLAEEGGFSYEKVRFSHASGRWGSCSSNGTISLNIALMKLSFELIDYVLIHELSHTVHMNHSKEFWQLVETIDPLYKLHRQSLKNETPSI